MCVYMCVDYFGVTQGRALTISNLKKKNKITVLLCRDAAESVNHLPLSFALCTSSSELVNGELWDPPRFIKGKAECIGRRVIAFVYTKQSTGYIPLTLFWVGNRT